MAVRETYQREQEVVSDLGALRGEGLSNHLAKDLKIDLNAQVQISELIKNTLGKNPARFNAVSENQLSTVLSNIYEELNPNLRVEQKLELISKLLSQTAPSKLPMNAKNWASGSNPEGEPLIMQSFKGKTVLEYLNQMATNPICETLKDQGYSKSQFLTSTIQDMLYTGNTQQGSMTATCAATCVQSYQITEDPEIFISRIAELVTQGKALNPDGSLALTLPNIIPTDDRTLTNSLYQTVLMDAGARMKEGSSGYNPLTDMVDGNVGMHKGIFSTQLKHLLDKATGKPHQVAYQGDDYESIISKNLNQRQNLVAVVEGIGSGDHMYHDVRVVGMEDGYVYFVNPWPEQYLKNEKGIEVINAENGLSRMPASSFLANTQYIAYETNNLSDFGRMPLGIDEKTYNPTPTQFFTIGIDSDTNVMPRGTDDFIKYLEKVQKFRLSHKITNKTEVKN